MKKTEHPNYCKMYQNLRSSSAVKEKAVIWFVCLFVSASLPLTSGPHFWCDSYGSALQGPGSLANSPPVLVYLKKLVSQKLLVAHGSYWRKAQDSWAAADFPALLVRMWGNSHLARSSGDCSSGKKKKKVIQQRVLNVTFCIFSEFTCITARSQCGYF